MVTPTPIKPPTASCVTLKWTRVSLCIWPGSSTNYSANGIVLTGPLMPKDNHLDGKSFKLTGSLVVFNQCTMLYVTKLEPCAEPTVTAAVPTPA